VSRSDDLHFEGEGGVENSITRPDKRLEPPISHLAMQTLLVSGSRRGVTARALRRGAPSGSRRYRGGVRENRAWEFVDWEGPSL